MHKYFYAPYLGFKQYTFSTEFFSTMRNVDEIYFEKRLQELQLSLENEKRQNVALKRMLKETQLQKAEAEEREALLEAKVEEIEKDQRRQATFIRKHILQLQRNIKVDSSVSLEELNPKELKKQDSDGTIASTLDERSAADAETIRQQNAYISEIQDYLDCLIAKIILNPTAVNLLSIDR